MSHARCACPKADRRGRPNYALHSPPDLGSYCFRCLRRPRGRAYAKRRPLPRSASPTSHLPSRLRYSLEVLPPILPPARWASRPAIRAHFISRAARRRACKAGASSILGEPCEREATQRQPTGRRQAYATDTHGSGTQSGELELGTWGRQAAHGFVTARYAQRTQMRPQDCTRTSTDYRHPGPLSVVFSSRCVPGITVNRPSHLGNDKDQT